MTALGPLSTDMYLPSLPAIGASFGSSTSLAQLSLSSFLAGFACGQIVYGPLSDRRGRKPVLLAGMALFLVASLASAFANSIEFLIIARFFQALGASGPIVLARAIVRDLYDGSQAGRELSRMGTIMGVVPAIAPILGGFLEAGFGWRSNFFVMTLIGMALGATIIFRLPETIRHRSREEFSFPAVLQGYRVLLRHHGYRSYVALSSLTYSGLFCFISGATFVLQGYYGLSEIAFGFSFASVVIGFISGSFTAQRVVTKLGLNRTISIGMALITFGGAAMVLLSLFAPKSVLSVIIPMAFYTGGVGFIMPQSMAGAMQPFSDRAGAASSLLGLIQMSSAAIAGVVVGHALEYAPQWPLPIGIASLAFASIAVFLSTRNIRAQV
jgi:DHA1 family bicyclomycin/chloramphenicol resistance-like MFS transporter